MSEVKLPRYDDGHIDIYAVEWSGDSRGPSGNNGMSKMTEEEYKIYRMGWLNSLVYNEIIN